MRSVLFNAVQVPSMLFLLFFQRRLLHKFSYSLLLSFSFACFAHTFWADASLSFAKNCGLRCQWASGAYLCLGIDAEAGTWHDDGVYASFGLEHQILRFSKIVFPFYGALSPNIWGHRWIFHIDFAPLYDAIRREDRVEIVYGYDRAGHPINGTNFYFDWYKNLGSRLYYLGSVPLIETYLGYETQDHTVKAGRLKNLVGLKDDEVFWGDDAKFAPMQHWLARDLLSGITYTYHAPWLSLSAGVFSGNNPMKGYGHYLAHVQSPKVGVQSPQIKANNTPTLSASVRFYYERWLSKAMEGFFFCAFQSNKMGSTWVQGLEDGKRKASVSTLGGVWSWCFPEQRWIQKVHILGQCTRFISGLDPDSAQNNGHPRFKTLRQQGFFVSASMHILRCLRVSGAYESFDRFDFLVYEKSLWGQNPLLPPDAKQKSVILNIRYAINSFAHLEGAYHIVKNPAPFVSDILDHKGDTRYKITLNIVF